MAKHQKIAEIKDPNWHNSFCLDEVIHENGNKDWAFVWRGTKISPEGFVNKPAYFDWNILGKLIKKSFVEKKVSDMEILEFFRGLMEKDPA